MITFCRILSVLSLALCFCTTDMAGGPGPGNGSETTNGVVICASGDPVMGGVVKVIDAENWLEKTILGLPVVLDSALTDSLGQFRFKSIYKKGTNLQFEWGSERLLYSVRSSDQSSVTDTFRLRRHANLKGTFDTGERPGRVALGGTDCQAIVDPGLQFSLAKTPSGSFPVVALYSGNRAALGGVHVLLPGFPTTTEKIQVDPSRITVDLFNSGFGPTEFNSLTGGVWYPFSSPANNAMVKILIEDSGNRYLQAELVKLSNSTSYAGVGFQIGRNFSDYYDFSSLRSISFRAKGTGTIFVSLEAEEIEKTNGPWPHFHSEVNLTPEWKDWEISVDSLIMPSYAPAFVKGYAWAQVSNRVNRVEFTSIGSTQLDTVSLSLDNVYLNGLDLNALVRVK